jgi:hypothetical protein
VDDPRELGQCRLPIRPRVERADGEDEVERRVLERQRVGRRQDEGESRIGVAAQLHERRRRAVDTDDRLRVRHSGDHLADERSVATRDVEDPSGHRHTGQRDVGRALDQPAVPAGPRRVDGQLSAPRR